MRVILGFGFCLFALVACGITANHAKWHIAALLVGFSPLLCSLLQHILYLVGVFPPEQDQQFMLAHINSLIWPLFIFNSEATFVILTDCSLGWIVWYLFIS